MGFREYLKPLPILSNDMGGGEIYLNHPVEKIIIDDNKVVGVVVGDEEHFFKTVH
ncbi:hypothetical protein C5S53_09430 [Methanophagales archaeon]|nr:hypothetical protein C5S53_09430 [Methanophagales archaeon]